VGYLLKAIIGAALFIGGTVLFNVKLVELLETGTCASGNQPFEIARQCPEGTETAILLMVAGIIGGLVGAALFLLRGTPPWASGTRRSTGTFGWATFGWGVFFTGTGAATLIASRTSEAMPEDGKLGGTIVGITFLVMGVPAILFALWGLWTAIADRDERPATAASAAGIGTIGSAGSGAMGDMLRNAHGMMSQTGTRSAPAPPAAPAGGGDTVSKLERLQRLRESGGLTEPEFEREKAKILAEL
jgi:hypothetical protein